MLNSLGSKNEAATIPDAQAMMMPQLLDSAQTHTSSRQYQLETTSFLYTKIHKIISKCHSQSKSDVAPL